MKKKEFKSQSLWFDFSYHLKNKNRYILDSESNEFIKTLLYKAKKRTKKLTEGGIFYRARIGHRNIEERDSLWAYEQPLKKTALLNPSKEKATEGRINPTGISYLYLSSDEVTAISETRPWIGQFVSVATCKILRTIKIIDVRSEINIKDVCLLSEKNVSSKQKEDRIWWEIDEDFAKPVTEHTTNVEYIPTQYLTEIFKKNGYDGVIYKSSVSKSGYNLALLFNIRLGTNIGIKKVELVRIKGLKYNVEKRKKLRWKSWSVE